MTATPPNTLTENTCHAAHRVCGHIVALPPSIYFVWVVIPITCHTFFNHFPGEMFLSHLYHSPRDAPIGTQL